MLGFLWAYLICVRSTKPLGIYVVIKSEPSMRRGEWSKGKPWFTNVSRKNYFKYFSFICKIIGLPTATLSAQTTKSKTPGILVLISSCNGIRS